MGCRQKAKVKDPESGRRAYYENCGYNLVTGYETGKQLI